MFKDVCTRMCSEISFVQHTLHCRDWIAGTFSGPARDTCAAESHRIAIILAPRFFLRGRFLGTDERLLSSFTSAFLSTGLTSLNFTSPSVNVNASKLELCLVLLSNLSTPVLAPNSCRTLTGLLTTTAAPSLGVGVNEASSGLLVILLGALAGSVLLCASLIALEMLQVRRCRAQRAGAKFDHSASVSPVQRSANSDATESLRRVSAPCVICASGSLPGDASAQSLR